MVKFIATESRMVIPRGSGNGELCNGRGVLQAGKGSGDGWQRWLYFMPLIRTPKNG